MLTIRTQLRDSGCSRRFPTVQSTTTCVGRPYCKPPSHHHAPSARRKERRNGLAPAAVASARHWKIESAASGVRRNRVGSPTAYSLHPHSGVLPFAAPDAHFMSRAGFLQHHLWVTAFHPNERFPGGDFPSQNPERDGLPKWTAADRLIDGVDLVLWHVF